MIASDTIAAISSPIGEGAIAVVRMSGSRCVEIADAVAIPKPSQCKAGVQSFARLHRNGTSVDEVMLSVHRAPRSYTGEDVVEIFCHGGVLVTHAVLTLLLQNGARMAEPGEFTQRAFLNGKMDLTQAEAVMDLIQAQTTLALRSATEQLEGRLGARILALREAVLQTLSHLEAYIDFPDEDIDPTTGEALAAQLAAAALEMQKLLATAEEGRVLREGIRTVIFGEPNVGKSSLLNLLLGFDRAIVNARPGTTRDTIEEVVNVRGIPLRLADTAGLREAKDDVEREGIARTKQQLDRAELVLHVVDASTPRNVSMEAPSEHGILVLNKCDLGVHPDWGLNLGVRLSCTEGSGLELLQQAIYDRIAAGCGGLAGGGVAINTRHRDCLARAELRTQASIAGLRSGLAPEFVSVEIREALEALGEIIGRVDTEDLLDRIFGNFCIGK